MRHGGFVATGLSALRVRPKRPFQVIQIVNHEVNTDILIQISAWHGQAQDIHRFAFEPVCGAHVIALAMVDQPQLGRFGVITEHLQPHIGQPCGRAMPDGTRQKWSQRPQTPHPQQRQLAQRQQLAGLRIGTKNGNVLAHSRFHGVVVGHTGARGQTQHVHGLLLG